MSNPKLLLLGLLVFTILTPILLMIMNGSSYLYIRSSDPINERPMQSKTNRFDRKHIIVPDGFFTGHQVNYYWYEPDYTSHKDEKFPLVVILHGGPGRAYAGKYLTNSDNLSRYPSFIFVPMLPTRSLWAYPKFMLGVKMELPYVVSAIKELKTQFPIDERRIYVVGCSNGGYGVFGASLDYDDIFAGGIAMSAHWNEGDANKMTTMPMMITAGAYDTVIDTELTRNMFSALDLVGAPIKYKEYDFGHNCPSKRLYEDEMWKWLFAQKL